MKALIGHYEAKLDTKRRLPIAAAIREQIDPIHGEGFAVVPNPDPEPGCERYLWLYPDDYFRRLVAKIKRSSLAQEERRGKAQWTNAAVIVKPDSQGRIVLPEKTLKGVVISEQVTLSCHENHIEVWPRKKWQEEFGTEIRFSRSVLDQAADELEEEDSRREEIRLAST